MSRIVLAISGGIAAYKSCHFCRLLRKAGHEVRVVMTAGAEQFVGRISLQALSGHPVATSLWESMADDGMDHIALGRWAERIVVAPASADVIARLAQGRADDLLTTLCLASKAPLTLAPAMNVRMWSHPATVANVETLRERGAQILGPVDGPLAEGESGPGRMMGPEDMLDALDGKPVAPCLAGTRVLVSAGPTYEDIDPVRFIGNRSSGRMGFAVAAAAARAGAEVTLVAGPVALDTPAGIAHRVNVRSARAMQEAVQEAARSADIFIAAAAVADYRPASTADIKIKKQPGRAGMTLELVENPDIVAGLGAQATRPFLVGFAAETNDLAHYARDKLARKHLDMIAANQVGRNCGFDACDNALEVFWDGGHQSLPRQSKQRLAVELVQLVARCHAAANKGKPS